MRILALEDEAAVSEVIRKGFVLKKCQVDCVNQSEAALQRIDETDFDLLVVDLHLRKVGSLKVLEHIR